MSLSAKNKNGDVVYSIGRSVKHQGDMYYCVGCGARMSLVLPYNRVAHFRHYPGQMSDSCIIGTGETEEHVAAKLFFYNKYVNDPIYEKVELESILELDGGGKRIGDVVLYPADHNVNPTVIEIQRSTITKFEIQERFHDWNSHGYSMMWVVIPSSGRVPAWVHYIKNIYFGALYVYVDGDIHIMHINKYADNIYDDISDFCMLRTPRLYDSDNYVLSVFDSDDVRDNIKQEKLRIVNDAYFQYRAYLVSIIESDDKLSRYSQADIKKLELYDVDINELEKEAINYINSSEVDIYSIIDGGSIYRHVLQMYKKNKKRSKKIRDIEIAKRWKDDMKKLNDSITLT